VYAVDKIIPLFNVYLNDGRSFKTDDISLEELKEHKEDKFDNSPEVEQYYEQLINLFAQNEERLFAGDGNTA